MKKNRSFLKWAGNKYHCIEHILDALPIAERLIEPFTGSAAVFMNTNYPLALLAEVNQDIIALLQYLQAEGDVFIDECERLFSADNNVQQHYYILREQFNQTTDLRRRAALFLYLNRHGYNGLCRYNQRGGYNVPFGRYIKPYFPRTEMRLFHQKSQAAIILQRDFRETFSQAIAGDIIYCDPPYAPLEQSSNFSAYTRTRFGEAEQVVLASLAEESALRGITVIISNHDTPFTRRLYQRAEIKSFMVSRHISCQAARRVKVKELIAVFHCS